MGEKTPTGAYDRRIRCSFMVPETRRLLTILFQWQKIQDRSLKFNRAGEVLSYLFDFIRPRTRYYVFQFSDPLPLATDLWSIITRAVTRKRPEASASSEKSA